MSSDSTRQSAHDNLQFDRAVPAEAPNGGSGELACALCNTPLRTQYFHVGDQPACAACKDTVERANQKAAAQSRNPGIFARSFGLGLVAAIAGAILYYGVIAVTGWEIGLVAIVIGFMVGWAIRKGSGGAGGRRYQWLAVILTYFAVGLAYAPLAFKSFSEGDAPAGAAADSASAVASSGASDSAAPADSAAVATAPAAEGDSAVKLGTAVAVGITFLFIFALPVMYIAGSMPSGLISAIIILVGMQQAWKMTAKSQVPISGPYKVGSRPSPSTA